MLRNLLFVLSLHALAGTAWADIALEQADCVFFEHEDREGAYWTAKVVGKDPISPGLTDWWQDRASSVWIREGFVLEAYADRGFNGTRIDVSSEVPLAHPNGEGFTVNLAPMNFNDQLSSYRCRSAGEVKVLARGSIIWFEGANYSWLSGGNHPDHKTLRLFSDGGELIVLAHADNTYGINRQDYRVNLTSGKVHADFVGSGMAKGQADFDLLLASMRPDFKITLQELIQSLQILAQGYASYPPTVEPPKPELQSLIAYLQNFVGS